MSTPGVVGPSDVARGSAVLGALVGDVDDFLRRYWAQQPHLFIGRDPDLGASLLSMADVDVLLSQRAPRLPLVRLVRGGQPIPPANFTTAGRLGNRSVGDLVDPARVAAEFAGGATVSLQGLHRYWQPLTDFCQALEAALTHPFQANAYLSPAGATGLAVHHDTHDVFVVQVEGSKHFDVYEPDTWLPVAGQHWSSHEPPGDPVISADLHPGDVLYMPRGWRHRAFTTDSHSLHLTIGLLGYTWLGLAAAVSEALAHEAAFREPLPPAFAHDPDALTAAVTGRLADLRAWLDDVDPAQLAATLTRRFVAGRAGTAGSVTAGLHPTSIEAATLVRRRPYTRCLLQSGAETVDLVLADRTVSFPAAATTLLHAILDADRFTAEQLPDSIDLAGRLVVVRRLVVEGLLEAA